MAELFDCGGPEVCSDDLCRGADEGICGIPHPHTVGEPCSSRDCWECVDWDGPDTAEDSDECPDCGFVLADDLSGTLERTPRSRTFPCDPCSWAHGIRRTREDEVTYRVVKIEPCENGPYICSTIVNREAAGQRADHYTCYGCRGDGTRMVDVCEIKRAPDWWWSPFEQAATEGTWGHGDDRAVWVEVKS